jgi:hypothetical protein
MDLIIDKLQSGKLSPIRRKQAMRKFHTIYSKDFIPKPNDTEQWKRRWRNCIRKLVMLTTTKCLDKISFSLFYHLCKCPALLQNVSSDVWRFGVLLHQPLRESVVNEFIWGIQNQQSIYLPDVFQSIFKLGGGDRYKFLTLDAYTSQGPDLGCILVVAGRYRVDLQFNTVVSIQVVYYWRLTTI